MANDGSLDLESFVHDTASDFYYNYRGHDEDGWPLESCNFEGNVITLKFQDGHKFKVTIEEIQ
jgi:hypothetical protein